MIKPHNMMLMNAYVIILDYDLTLTGGNVQSELMNGHLELLYFIY